LCVIPYSGEDDAVRIANDSDYGLAGSVWTGDVEHGLEVARRVRTGTIGVNQYMLDFIRLRRVQGQRHRARVRAGGHRRVRRAQVRRPPVRLTRRRRDDRADDAPPEHRATWSPPRCAGTGTSRCWCSATSPLTAARPRRVSRYAQALDALGVGATGSAALLSSNRPEVLLIVAAGQMLGSRRTALHPLASLDDHAYALTDAPSPP